MHIFQYLKDWLRPGETSFNNDANESLASSFVSLSRPLEQEDPEVERLVANLLTLHTELAAKTDLRPGEEVNVLFGGLMGLCTQTVSGRVANKVMSNPQLLSILPSLRHICAEAEGHLESHWADIISGAENESQHEEAVYDRLLKFPYFSNYTDLTRLELAAIHAIYPSPIRKIAFIGSGPLPLTSLQLLHAFSHNIEILNIDHDSSAIFQSSRLCDRLGSKGEGMRFLCSEAGACDLTEFDVVYLAALVGSTQEEKEVLLINIVGKMRERAILVVRSAHGLRRALYAEFDPTTEAVRRCLNVQIVVHPYNHVVNSVIVGKPRSRNEDNDIPRK